MFTAGSLPSDNINMKTDSTVRISRIDLKGRSRVIVKETDGPVASSSLFHFVGPSGSKRSFKNTSDFRPRDLSPPAIPDAVTLPSKAITVPIESPATTIEAETKIANTIIIVFFIWLVS